MKTLLKGLGHAILGNFGTDQVVIELTKISKERLSNKYRKGEKGHGWI